MEKQFIYTDFLENYKVYEDNQSFWRELLSKIIENTNLSFSPYLNSEYANGEKIYDGNPIFDALVLPTNKAIRIIQHDPKEYEMNLITAWTDKVELENEEVIPELVLNLYLAHESKSLAEDFIKKWILEDFDNKKMDAYIDEVTESNSQTSN